MFDIGFLELLIIGVLALLVLGPERLPGAVRTVSLWITKIRRSFQQIKLEIEREVDIAELKQQLHNDSIMQKLEETKTDIEQNVQQAREQLEKELGDDNYNLSGVFNDNKPVSDFPDTLPDHPPLPDPDELLEIQERETKEREAKERAALEKNIAAQQKTQNQNDQP